MLMALVVSVLVLLLMVATASGELGWDSSLVENDVQDNFSNVILLLYIVVVVTIVLGGIVGVGGGGGSGGAIASSGCDFGVCGSGAGGRVGVGGSGGGGSSAGQVVMVVEVAVISVGCIASGGGGGDRCRSSECGRGSA